MAVLSHYLTTSSVLNGHSREKVGRIGKAGQGKAGQGRAGQGRAGQGKAGQGDVM